MYSQLGRFLATFVLVAALATMAAHDRGFLTLHGVTCVFFGLGGLVTLGFIWAPAFDVSEQERQRQAARQAVLEDIRAESDDLNGGPGNPTILLNRHDIIPIRSREDR